jgi:hypothetical protein
MAKIHDGGAAFPRPASIDTTDGSLLDGDEMIDPQPGMSLRDWFAGQALAGHLAFTFEGLDEQSTPEEAAATAYRMADAMLVARGCAPKTA